MALDLSALTNPYGQELAGIERNRALATALMQGGQQQPQGQMISGRYVAPSFAQQLNPLMQTLAGAYGQSQADTKQTQLANTMQQKQAEILRGYSQATTPQEKFALGTNPYAPAALQAATWDKLKTQKIGADETLLEGGIGGYTPSFTGPSKLPESLQYAVSVGQLPRDPQTWTKQQADYAKTLVLQKVNAGASKYDFSNLLGKSNIGEISPMLKESKLGAVEAIEKADAANKVIKALSSGNAITGPAANQRLALNQVGTMLGVTGTDQEKAVKSREILQGLAQLTLSGRKGMKGQGAMDKMEGELANQVMSGKLDFTPAELNTIANGALKSAKNQYKQHENMMTQLRKDEPKTSPYFEVPVNPDIFEPITAPTTGSQTPSLGTALDIIRRTPTGAK